MKQIIIFVLFLVGCLFTTVPLGAKEAFDLLKGKNELNLVYYRQNTDQLLLDAMSDFEKSSGIKVNLIFVHLHSLRQMLVKAALFKGGMPDVVMAPSDFSALASDIRLSHIPPSLLSPELMPAAVASVTFQNTHFGIPIIGGNHLMLYYNKKFVKTPATTWQQLQSQALQIESMGVKLIGWFYPEMYWFAGFAATFGGMPITDSQFSLNSQGYIDGLKFYKSLTDSKLVNPRCGYDCSQKDFINEKYAYSINGDWALIDFEAALGDNLGITLLPAIGDKPFKPFTSSVALFFPDGSLKGPKAKALSALARFFQSRQFQDKLFPKERFLPVNMGSFKAVEQTASPNIVMMLQQLKQAVPMPPDPMMSNAWLGMKKGFRKYMSGVASAEEAAAYMQKFAEWDYQKSQAGKQR